MNAVKEANRLNIPVIAMVDTCCDPTPIDYVIPANDDAAKSISLIVGTLCDAVTEGLQERRIEKEKEKEVQASAENKEGEAPVGKKVRPRKNVAPKEEAPVEAAPAAEAKAE